MFNFYFSQIKKSSLNINKTNFSFAPRLCFSLSKRKSYRISTEKLKLFLKGVINLKRISRAKSFYWMICFLQRENNFENFISLFTTSWKYLNYVCNSVLGNRLRKSTACYCQQIIFEFFLVCVSEAVSRD